ncbi:ABC-type amino acid transport substrate-binding protein [Enterococcus sp. PF1-24]|uniref:transporter substrate-binding domain-containing protein n=1 Tax=unclassified Enterococcus TaxID=2608891 RepID=UPI0024759CBB|nr:MULTISPECIES: transporter substrate-binding domain-containing protein [unclassified Enterococcus]MDH6365621.1 ABC-type amino acid transport substrate-binding protein [Enterococcus sp. PFB1-1]MDH6402732.1 ABC-type amino acid transport substrate-binding protein [Enterococcus sp. PF1-24]
MKKKNILVGILFTLLLAFTACGGNNQGKKDDSGNTMDKLAQIKESGKLVVGTSPDFPPSEFYVLDENNKKQIVGRDISLAQAIADEIGVKLELKATDFNGVLANIQTDSLDFGISGFVGTKERSKIMDFSDGYQQETSDGYQGILTTKENVEKYTTLAELQADELTVGAQGGSIQFELASDITTAAKIKQYGTIDAAILALNAGDIDAITVSTTSVTPLLSSFPELAILPQAEFDLDVENMYATNVIGFPKRDDNESFIKLCNEVIQKSKDNGDLKKWRDEATVLAEKAIEE